MAATPSPKPLAPIDDLDANVWWHLSETRVDNYTRPSFGAMLQVADDGAIFVFGTEAAQYWQFQPLSRPGRYALRCSKTQMSKQLSVCYSPDEIDENKTRPCLADPSGAEEQQWDVFDHGDETLGFVNVKNGTSLYLDVRPGAHVYMSSNINGQVFQPGQHWILTSQGDVGDGAYSTTFSDAPVSTPSANGTTKMTSSPSSTDFFPSGNPQSGSSLANPDDSRAGLSSGAVAGVGIGASLVVIALFFAACYLYKHHCRRENPGTASSDPCYRSNDAAETTPYSPLGKPSLYSCDSPTQHPPGGGDAPLAREMAREPAPSELPAGTHYSELEAVSSTSYTVSPHLR